MYLRRVFACGVCPFEQSVCAAHAASYLLKRLLIGIYHVYVQFTIYMLANFLVRFVHAYVRECIGACCCVIAHAYAHGTRDWHTYMSSGQSAFFRGFVCVCFASFHFPLEHRGVDTAVTSIKCVHIYCACTMLIYGKLITYGY